jgi:hypothetical protein
MIMDATRTLLEQLERDMREDVVMIQYLDHDGKLQTWSGCPGNDARLTIEGLRPYLEIQPLDFPWRDSPSDPILIALDKAISIVVDRYTGDAEDPCPSIACWLRHGAGDLQRFTHELPNL